MTKIKGLIKKLDFKVKVGLIFCLIPIIIWITGYILLWCCSNKISEDFYAIILVSMSPVGLVYRAFKSFLSCPIPVTSKLSICKPFIPISLIIMLIILFLLGCFSGCIIQRIREKARRRLKRKKEK